MTAQEPHFEQIVFATTVDGYAELRNPQTSLSLQERTVLTLIDGVCPVASYLPYLHAFEPVVQKIKKLEQLGYLRRTQQVARISAGQDSAYAN
jgi:hypothetical protein